jgi:hypothetical protein
LDKGFTKVMGDRDETKMMRLLIEAQNAFDELFAEGRIKTRVRVYRVEKAAEPNYYAVKLFSIKKFMRVFWMGDGSFKSFKTAVQEVILRHVK